MPPITWKVRDTEEHRRRSSRPSRPCCRSTSSGSSGLEFIRATEAGALSAYKWMGKGDKESADFAACDAIRGLFDTVNISGLVTIGEGIKDNAPGIFKGEKLGTWSTGSIKMAIALDPDRRHDDRQQGAARRDQRHRRRDVRERRTKTRTRCWPTSPAST